MGLGLFEENAHKEIIEGNFELLIKGLMKEKLKKEHDNSLLYEELEEHFGQLTDEEKQYAKNVFTKEVLSKLIFEGASTWMDSNLKEYKKSIN